MNKKDSHIDINQYNKEIDEAIARVESGDYYTQREVEKILNDDSVLQELEGDVIGGLGPLTKQDEKAISDFIQAGKESKS